MVVENGCDSSSMLAECKKDWLAVGAAALRTASAMQNAQQLQTFETESIYAASTARHTHMCAAAVPVHPTCTAPTRRPAIMPEYSASLLVLK